MTAIVLAGGTSRRLGRYKALEILGGQSLIERVIDRLSWLDTEIIVVTAREDQAFPPDLKVKMVSDVYPGGGALVGIYSGLQAASNFYSLVVACDMPFLNVALLRYLMGLSSGFEAVIPKLEGNLEPLHAVYSKDCLGPIEDMLGDDRLKVTGLPGRLKARYVENEEVERFDPEHLSFFNINSESDLQQAKVLLDKERSFLNI